MLAALRREVEDSLDEAVRRADEEQGRADSAREELSGLTEKMQQAEYDWQRWVNTDESP